MNRFEYCTYGEASGLAVKSFGEVDFLEGAYVLDLIYVDVPEILEVAHVALVLSKCILLKKVRYLLIANAFILFYLHIVFAVLLYFFLLFPM